MTILIICIGVIILFFIYNLHLKKQIKISKIGNKQRTNDSEKIDTESISSSSTFSNSSKTEENNNSKLSSTVFFRSHVTIRKETSCDDNNYEDPKAYQNQNDRCDGSEYEDPRVDSRSEFYFLYTLYTCF